MLTNVMSKLEGKKTYILSILGILVALVGKFWGPIDWGPIQIPAMEWGQVWEILWGSGLFAALRARK